MIAHALRGPHNLYRRYQAFLESTLTSTSLAILVVLVLYALPVYPEKWVAVMGISIALLGIRWPSLAYLITIGALVYPIYLINLYLAVLFLAVSALGQRVFVHFMGATVLVLATPALAQYHLHWLVPILGGLWWGGMVGAWVGGLAAIWGKLLGGWASLDTDWLVLAGNVPDPQAITEQFQGANSLQTLLLLIDPFAATPNVLLYNLLQVVGWIIAAWFVGSLAHRKWVKHYNPWSIMLVSTGGGLILLGTHLGIPYWLPDAITDETVQAVYDPSGSLFSLIMVIIVGTTVYGLRESLELPVAPKRNIRQKSKKTQLWRPVNLFKRIKKKTEKKDTQEESEKEEEDLLDRPRRPVRVPSKSELPEWEPPKDESELIMLEID